MESKTLLLKALMEEWIERHKNESDADYEKCKGDTVNISKKSFCIDGIINESVYLSEKTRVLFVSNEANDDEYSAKTSEELITSRIESFQKYYETGDDCWRGRMRERICAIYREISGEKNVQLHKLANRFAFMNINKRGGTNNIGDGEHLINYCELYKDFMLKEIEIIEPDIIVWLGVKSFNLGIPQTLGAETNNGITYFKLRNKAVPVMRMWHTCYCRYPKKKLEYYNELENEYKTNNISTDTRIIKFAAKTKSEFIKLSSALMQKQK